MIIETKNLGKNFGKIRAVHDLNLQVKERSIYGLIGPNGAGKTTTIGMLCGFLRISSGDAIVLGKSIASGTLHLHKTISVVPQSALFYPQRTVSSHLMLYGRLQGLSKEKAYQETETLSASFGLADKRNTEVKSLSGGMIKLLAITQGLMGNPVLVLMDEPTAGLDPSMVVRVKKILKERVKSTTFVISSHALGELEQVCTRVGFMKDGTLVLEDELEHVIKRRQRIFFQIGNINKHMIAALQKVPGVTQVERMSEGILVFSNEEKSIIPKLVALLVAQKAEIQGIKEGISLEDAFMDVMNKN